LEDTKGVIKIRISRRTDKWCPKEKGQNDRQPSTKHYREN